MNTPLVSILMTVYNREKYISDAIQSVLSSSYQNWELIIVDDRSKDQSVEIARQFELKDSRIKVYVNEKNLGQFENRMMAASYASGTYIKYLDSDDMIYPHGLEVMVSSMEKFPEAAIGLTYNAYEEDEPLPLTLTPEEAFLIHFFKKGILYVGPTNTIFRTKDFRELKGFEDYGVASDYELNLRMAMHKPVVLFNRDLAWWRRHENQEISLHEKEYLYQNHRIFRKVIYSSAFPLNNRKRKEIKNNYDKNFARKIIVLLALLNFRKAIYIWRTVKLGPNAFFLAMMPAKLRKMFI